MCQYSENNVNKQYQINSKSIVFTKNYDNGAVRTFFDLPLAHRLPNNCNRVLSLTSYWLSVIDKACKYNISSRSDMCMNLVEIQENKSDQPTKSDMIPGNESTNGSVLFSL